MTPLPHAQRLTVTRRAFVVGSAVLSAGAAIPAMALAESEDHTGMLALFDGRIEDGRRFAAMAGSAGYTAQDTGRDLAQLLYGTRRDWATDGSTILAGVTRYADFQVASGIAREQGRTVLAAVAREKTGGALQLIAGSPPGLDRLARRLGRTGPGRAGLEAIVREGGSIAWVCA